MSSTIYQPVRTPPPALGGSAAPAARVAKVLSGAGGASQSGIWVGIFAITMSFVAFTSALFVRQGSGADWTHIALPPVLYGNTLALLLSSATLQMARRALAAVPSVDPRAVRMGLSWLMATRFGDGENCRERRRVSKEYVRSDRDLLALHGSFVALSASRFAHQAVSVWEGEGL